MLSQIETPTKTHRSRQRVDGERVLRGLLEYCQERQPGDVFPSHQELMRQFEASERSVRWALDELRREGRIVGRQGARTYVADVNAVSGNGAIQAAEPKPPVAVETRTIIAVAIPDHALFDQAMKLLVEQARMEGISVICHLLAWDEDQSSQLPAMSQEPLGYIVFRRELLGLAEELQSQGHRVVAVATPFAGTLPGVPAVYGDHEQGGYLATQHLIELGHRRIAFCCNTDVEQTSRWQGHERALREAARRGLQIQTSMLDLSEIWDWKDNPERGEAIFRAPSAPTGLVVWNDHEAIMVMGRLNRYGLRVPQDISIVGYDNLPEGELQHPSLTTVYSPMDQQLKTALNLLDRPTVPAALYQFLIQPTLIARESSAPPPAVP